MLHQCAFVRKTIAVSMACGRIAGLILGAAVCTAQAADMNVTHFGAKPDDQVFDTKAIQDAIDACGKGDRVVVPAGKFLIATIWVKSDMTLYLSEGAVLESSPNWKDFGNRWSWENAMIRARNNLQDITIEGPGLIDGVDCFCPKGEVGMRGPHAINLSGKGQSNIRISGITIVNSANYAILIGQGAAGHTSEGVTIENVKVRGGWDGFDFNRGTDITVKDCDFRTGDGCIAGVANQDVKILNSRFNSSMQGVRITGNNVVIRDCEFWGPGEYEHKKQKTRLSRPAIWPPDWKRGQPNTPSDNWVIEDGTCSEIGVVYKYSKRAGGFGVRRITCNNITATTAATSNAPAIAISGEEARVSINGGKFSVGSKAPTIIEMQNVDCLELRNVTLRIDGDRPAIRARKGNTVLVDGVKTVPASNKRPFDLTGIAAFRETRVPVEQ